MNNKYQSFLKLMPEEREELWLIYKSLHKKKNITMQKFIDWVLHIARNDYVPV